MALLALLDEPATPPPPLKTRVPPPAVPLWWVPFAALRHLLLAVRAVVTAIYHVAVTDSASPLFEPTPQGGSVVAKHRSIAFGEGVSLNAIKAIKNQMGGGATVNDVVAAIVTICLR